MKVGGRPMFLILRRDAARPVTHRGGRLRWFEWVVAVACGGLLLFGIVAKFSYGSATPPSAIGDCVKVPATGVAQRFATNADVQKAGCGDSAAGYVVESLIAGGFSGGNPCPAGDVELAVDEVAGGGGPALTTWCLAPRR
jgi:hypothetical protein